MFDMLKLFKKKNKQQEDETQQSVNPPQLLNSEAHQNELEEVDMVVGDEPSSIDNFEQIGAEQQSINQSTTSIHSSSTPTPMCTSPTLNPSISTTLTLNNPFLIGDQDVNNNNNNSPPTQVDNISGLLSTSHLTEVDPRGTTTTTTTTTNTSLYQRDYFGINNGLGGWGPDPIPELGYNQLCGDVSYIYPPGGLDQTSNPVQVEGLPLPGPIRNPNGDNVTQYMVVTFPNGSNFTILLLYTDNGVSIERDFLSAFIRHLRIDGHPTPSVHFYPYVPDSPMDHDFVIFIQNFHTRNGNLYIPDLPQTLQVYINLYPHKSLVLGRILEFAIVPFQTWCDYLETLSRFWYLYEENGTLYKGVTPILDRVMRVLNQRIPPPPASPTQDSSWRKRTSSEQQEIDRIFGINYNNNNYNYNNNNNNTLILFNREEEEAELETSKRKKTSK